MTIRPPAGHNTDALGWNAIRRRETVSLAEGAV